VAGDTPLDDATSGQCPTPLSDAQLATLALTLLAPSIAIAPGGTHDFDVYEKECCYILKPIEACVEWSVFPTEGASIDSDTGVLSIDATTAGGTIYTVTANVEDGKAFRTIDVAVVTNQSNPLIGLWVEEAQHPCDGGAEVPPEQKIQELAIYPAGEINVTWMPFEVYVDYWGKYVYDLQSGTLELTATGGNYMPDDIDGSGTFSLNGGNLVLHDMWLGSPVGGSAPAKCGHRFK
jgi:hypothetical protein